MDYETEYALDRQIEALRREKEDKIVKWIMIGVLLLIVGTFGVLLDFDEKIGTYLSHLFP